MEKLMAEYLANELSEKKRSEFEAQLVDDEQVRSEFEDYLNLWHESEQAGQASFDVDKAWAGMSVPKAPQQKVISIERKSNYTLLKIAATLLIVFTAGYFLSDTVQETLTNSITSNSLTELTTGSETKEFQLPDGSAIKLNANSSLAYEKGFGDTHRNIKLVGGANFDVERNEALPFVISAETSEVEVLGTSFDVNAYPDKDIELNVTEGRVKFSSKADNDKSGLVKAGERAMLSQDGSAMEQGEMKGSNYAAWWTRKLVFEATSFEEVVKDLENTYWVDIEFSEALSGCRLTATYDNESFDNVLDLLAATYADNQLKVVRTKENQIKLEGKVCAN